MLNMSNFENIAIIGAGPAGLTLALYLHKHNIPYTLYDLRPQPFPADFAQPAGPLDLHEGTGLAAISALGLYEEFLTLTGDCTESQRIANKHGEIIYSEDDKDAGVAQNRPEISRLKLIGLLLSHIPVGSIKWSHKLLSSAHSDETSTTTLKFSTPEGESTVKASLVVGADGAHSRIRPLLTPIKPGYTGFHVVSLDIRSISDQYRSLEPLIGSGSFFCLAEHHGLMSQRSVNSSARIWVYINTPDEHYIKTHNLYQTTHTAAKDFLLGPASPFHTWSRTLTSLISIACESETAHNPLKPLDIKPLYTLPAAMHWPHKRGITLIGDAAHLTNPGAGEGANHAMWDALELGKVLVETAGNKPETSAGRDEQIKAFEEQMLAAAKIMAEESKEVSDLMYEHENGSERLVEFFNNAFAQLAEEAEGRDP